MLVTGESAFHSVVLSDVNADAAPGSVGDGGQVLLVTPSSTRSQSLGPRPEARAASARRTDGLETASAFEPARRAFVRRFDGHRHVVVISVQIAGASHRPIFGRRQQRTCGQRLGANGCDRGSSPDSVFAADVYRRWRFVARIAAERTDQRRRTSAGRFFSRGAVPLSIFDGRQAVLIARKLAISQLNVPDSFGGAATHFGAAQMKTGIAIKSTNAVALCPDNGWIDRLVRDRCTACCGCGCTLALNTSINTIGNQRTSDVDAGRCNAGIGRYHAEVRVPISTFARNGIEIADKRFITSQRTYRVTDTRTLPTAISDLG